MIHQFKQGGFNIVLDICSGSIHVVDDIAYDVIALFGEKGKKEMSSYIFSQNISSLPAYFLFKLFIKIQLNMYIV